MLVRKKPCQRIDSIDHIDCKTEAMASTPQMANSTLNQPLNVAAGFKLSQGTDHPVLEQDNKNEGPYGSPKLKGKVLEV